MFIKELERDRNRNNAKQYIVDWLWLTICQFSVNKPCILNVIEINYNNIKLCKELFITQDKSH